MKIHGFKALRKGLPFEAYALHPFTLPLENIISRKIVGLGERRELHLLPERSLALRSEVATSLRVQVPRIALKKPLDGLTEFTGFLCVHGGKKNARTIRDLLAAAGRREAGQDGEIQSAVSDLSEWVEEAIDDLMDIDRYHLFTRQLKRLARCLEIGILPSAWARRFFERVETSEGPGFFLNADGAYEFLIPFDLACGGHEVPRREFVLLSTDPSGYEYSLHWDGQAIRAGGGSREMPRALIDRLETLGYCTRGDTGEFLPPPPHRQLCLLRVPSRQEAGAFRDGTPLEEPFTRPLMLVDTRAPVALEEGLKVHADPGLAYAVLARTSSRWFDPGDVRVDPRTCLEDRPYFLVAGELR